MTNRNKADKTEKEQDKTEWQLTLDLQEKKILLEGMKEACNDLKLFLKAELSEIKNEISGLKKVTQEANQKIH